MRLPEEHAVQLMALAAAYWPARHCTAVVGSEHCDPAGQLSHVVCPVAVW